MKVKAHLMKKAVLAEDQSALVTQIIADWINGNISCVKKAIEKLKGKEAVRVGAAVYVCLPPKEALVFLKWLSR